MSDLKQEFRNFMDDLEKNIENPNDLQYVKERTTGLFENVLQKLEEIINFKEEKIAELEKKQEQLETNFNNVQKTVNDIKNDIYAEDESFEFEIICPYCDHEFIVEDDESRTEIECPECNNIIELDWSEDGDDCCSGHCSGCHGCGDIEEQEDDDM